jgi:hypothetical protein
MIGTWELGDKNGKTELVYREEDQSWYMKKGKKYQKLVKVNLGETQNRTSYTITLPKGEMNVNSRFDPVALKEELTLSNQVVLQ